VIQRARSFFRDSDTSVALTVGIVGGFALRGLFLAFAWGFVLPIIQQNVGAEDPERALVFTLFGIMFTYPQVVAELTAILLLAAVGYVLFVWGGGEPAGPGLDTRDCPDCKSEIWIDARRCPYCTSVVPPLTDTAEEA
jgi:large conductance mechanosensitive channel